MATRKISAAVARAQKGGTKNHPILGPVPKPGSGRWDGAMRGVPLLGPVPKTAQARKTRLQQHERSPNTGASKDGPAWPGLGKRLGGRI